MRIAQLITHRRIFPRAGQRTILLFDAVGKLSPLQAKKALKKTGTYLNVDNTSGDLKVDDLIFLKELLEAGKIKPVIDRCYTLDQIVEAHRYVEKGHKKGNVVITLDHYHET